MADAIISVTLAEPAIGNGKAYATLLLTDRYLPGALVVASQLRKLAPNQLIVCLATKESLSAETLAQLEEAFDKVHFVEPIDAGDSPELQLLRRPELRLATTKLWLFCLPYNRIVYLDADTLPLKEITELMDIPLAKGTIAAAPDVGWPDLFNSGVMALVPDKSVVPELLSQLHTSLDGSDQGLLNESFEWQRVPFVYNVTVTGSYEYAPAYNRFQNDIRVLHFIGALKPWDLPSSHSNEVEKWWATYSALNIPSTETIVSAVADNGELENWEKAPDYYDEKQVIQPSVDRRDALTLAPLLNSRPEAAQLLGTVKQLTIIEKEPENNIHVYPAYGPTTVVLPFENNMSPPERIFD